MKFSSKLILYIFGIVASIFYLLPMYTLINVSLKSTEELIYGPVVPPRHIYLGAYQEAWYQISDYFLNSIIMVLPATITSTLLGSLSGYAFFRFKSKISNMLLLLIVTGFYVPPQAILIPLIRFMSYIGLYGTIYGLILTHVAYGMPITTLLFRNYYETIPKEILDSSEVDGAGEWLKFIKIIFPLSLPGMAVVLTFQFTNIWNDFLFGLVLSQGRFSQPVTVAIANLKGTTLAAWNVQMAGAAIGAIPVVIFYIFGTRLIIKGLTAGAIKA
ncbi:MAG: carbohydrate ABC transporter permease [Candidatus Bathyarchaeia archaeon]